MGKAIMIRFGLIAMIVAMQLALALPAWAEKRLALVIGNAKYEHATSLRNPENDATDVAAALRRLDFEVVLGVDLSKSDFDQALRSFGRRVDDADVVLFYFAGHGIQFAGENFLLPTDVELSRPDGLPFEAIKLSDVIAQLDSRSHTSMLFIDACRDNPFVERFAEHRSVGFQSGLAPARGRGGTLVAFATEPGRVANDGNGRNSPFTEALLNHIETPNIVVQQMLQKVGLEVYRSTEGNQLPWTQYSALFGDFYFNMIEEERPAVLTTDEQYWETIKESDDRDLIQEFIIAFPQSSRRQEALLRDRELQNRTSPVASAKEPHADRIEDTPDSGVTATRKDTISSATGPVSPETHDSYTGTLSIVRLDPDERPGTNEGDQGDDRAGISGSARPNGVEQQEVDVASLIKIIPQRNVRARETIPLPVPQKRSIVVDAVNIRRGPGASFPIVGRVLRNQQVNVVGHSPSGTWLELQLSNGDPGYVYAPLVGGESFKRRSAMDQQRAPGERFRDCDDCPQMVAVSLAGPDFAGTNGLAVSSYEVTFAEWDACVAAGGCGGYSPDDEGWGRGDRPAINISFQDANRFVDWLNGRTDQNYRLLSGREWELLAHAGSPYDQPWGNNQGYACQYANVHDESSRKENRFRWQYHKCNDGFPTTAPVGRFLPNAYGLYDMVGNVAEWTSECEGTECSRRMLRGGSWYDPPRKVGVSASTASAITTRASSDGFRVARALPEGLKDTMPDRPIVVIAN